MSASHASRVASQHTPADRRRSALAAMLGLAGASSLVLLVDLHAGPAWVHWAGSLMAIAAALGVVVIGQLGWARAIDTAKSAGLVAIDHQGRPS